MAAATFHNRFVLTAQRSYVKENKNQGYYNAGLMVDTCKALFVSKWMSLKLAVFRLGLYRLQRIQIPVSIFFFFCQCGRGVCGQVVLLFPMEINRGL